MTTYTNDYSVDPSITSTGEFEYIIHSSNVIGNQLTFSDYLYMKISSNIVANQIGDYTNDITLGLTDISYQPFASIFFTWDTNNANRSITSTTGYMMYTHSGNTTYCAGTSGAEVSLDVMHKLELEYKDTWITFSLDGVAKTSSQNVSGLSHIDRFTWKAGTGGGNAEVNTHEYDAVNDNMHFKTTRTDASPDTFCEHRWDDLKISDSASDGPTQVAISNTSGCTVSGGTTATISAKVTNSSGNVYFYYESGATGGGTTKGNWDSSIAYGSTVYSGSYITKGLTGLSRDYTYSFRGYVSSNGWGGGEDWFDTTDTFTTLSTDTTHYDEGNSLRIYVSCNNYPNNYIDCWATRFDEGNWDVTFETFMGSGARNFLFDNVVPGAVTELYTILGEPHFIDSTYSSSNSLRISPLGNTGLSGLRQERIIGVKNISDRFLVPDKFSLKIEGVIL